MHIKDLFNTLIPIVYYKIHFISVLRCLCAKPLTNTVTRNLQLMTILMELYVAQIREHMHNIARYLKFYTLLVKSPLIKNYPIKALFVMALPYCLVQVKRASLLNNY